MTTLKSSHYDFKVGCVLQSLESGERKVVFEISSHQVETRPVKSVITVPSHVPISKVLCSVDRKVGWFFLLPVIYSQ